MFTVPKVKNFKLVQALNDDRSYLFDLRKLTMVAHLEREGLYLSDDQFRLRVDDKYECAYLIVSSGEKIGVINYQEFVEKIVIMQIQIHPDFQGRGFGQRVIKQILDSSRTKSVELSVLKSNPAISLYERIGFSITGEDENEFFMEFNNN